MLNYNKGFFYSLRETQCHGHVLLFFLLGNLFFSYSVTLLDKLLALFLFDAFWMFSIAVFFCDAFLVVSLAVFPSAVILVVFLAFFVFDPFLVVPLVFFLFAPPWNDCDLYMIPSSWTKASCLLCFSFLLFFFLPQLDLWGISIIRVIDSIYINIFPSFKHFWLYLNAKTREKICVGGAEALVEMARLISRGELNISLAAIPHKTWCKHSFLFWV